MKPTFKKATRKQAKLKIGITGPSGSGKTYSALKIANGFLDGKGKIAVIDTENGSASLYSDMCEYDTIELKPPFTTEKYSECINAAVEGEYDFLIIDSISHAWAGEGGILDQKGKLDSKPGTNSYTNWAKFTPVQEKFLSSILQSDINVIVTMRSKQDYVLSQNSKGKMAPQKIGLAPVQRDGIEYELTLCLDMDMTNNCEASKDRTGLFHGKRFSPSEETGKQLKAWVDGGVEDNSKLLKEFSHGLNDFAIKRETGPLEVLLKEFEMSKDQMVACSNDDLFDMINRLGELQ